MKKSSSRTIYKRVVIILFILLVICAAAAIILIRTPGARYRHNVNLGRRYMHGRQYDEAVRVFTKAIEVDPDRSEAYRGRGDAYVKMDEMEQAYDDYKRVEELTGESGLAERKTGLSDPSETGSSGTETPQTVTLRPVPGLREITPERDHLRNRHRHLLRRCSRHRKRRDRRRRIMTLFLRLCAVTLMVIIFRMSTVPISQNIISLQ